jgi:four helix bundle protein
MINRRKMRAKGDDIEERLISFAVRIIKLCDSLPQTRAGGHIAGQLLRSGTSPAANYAEARSAESARDFVHKLKIGLKELNESRIWLQIITQSKLLPESRLTDLNQECDELCKTISASITTARKKRSALTIKH